MQPRLLVTDHAGDRIRVVGARDGAVATWAGSGVRGGADGAALGGASFHGPHGVAVAARDGTVYISEVGGHRIRAIAPDG